MLKKISLSVVLVIGVVWFVATFAFNLWAKGPAVDGATSALKPAFTDAGIAQEKSDSQTINAFIKDLNTTTVPLVAKLSDKSNAEVVSLLGTAFPTVGKLLSTNDNAGQPYADGKTYLAHAAGYVETVATAFGEQQKNFPNAEQIPTKFLPTVALAWLFAILGLVMLVVGGAFIWKPELAKLLGATLVVLGLVVVAVTYLINVPGKTQSVDDLTNAFRPVFSKSGPMSIDEGQKYLQAVRAADVTLETKLVPTLADLLKTTPATVTSAVSDASPVVAKALFAKDPANPKVSVLGGILDRWDGIAAIVVDQRANFAKTDNLPGWGMPTTMIQFLLVGPAVLLMLSGIGLGFGPRPAPQPGAAAPRRQTAGTSV